jgi:AraC-like DNA-binding protein
MSKDVYISCALADTLRDYIDRNLLVAPDVLAALAPYSSSQRMPILLFWRQLERLQEMHPVPALGLRIGLCAKPQHFGVVGYLAASCSVLGQALMRYRRFQRLLVSNLDVRVEQRGEVIRYSWGQGEHHTTPLASEFGVAAFINLYQALIGQVIPPSAIEIPYPRPEQSSIYEALAGCPVRFDAPCHAMEMPVSLLAMRVTSSDPYLRDLFERQAHAMLAQHPRPDAFLDQLQQQMMTALQEGEPSAAMLAERMSCSLRSFYRKLAEYGLCYRALLGDVRFKLARMYLADSRLSLVEVALLLGYSEQSAFSRAFRKWSGSTPQEYRRSRLSSLPLPAINLAR